ncbi:MAG: VIT family protein [Acidimicrobiales bacterium]
MQSLHADEEHRGPRAGWLRAAVLGANDGLVSTASLVIGVAATQATTTEFVVAGIAAVVAGAMTMSAGEYVSVKAQQDVERADIEIEKRSLETLPHLELLELAEIYEERGLEPELALQVAEELTAHDALGAHLRDELGHSELNTARPVQAATSSALPFALFAIIPVLIASATSDALRIAVIATTTIVMLAALGALGAHLGGAPKMRAALRVTVGGSIAMLITALIGNLIGGVI